MNLPALKQLSIDAGSTRSLLKARASIFRDEVDALSEQLYTGKISLGQWEETMKAMIRELHTSSLAIGKGGWGNITQKDFGAIGTPLKKQYRYLHGFAEYIDENRDTVSLNYIQDRSHKYVGSAAFQTLRMLYGDILANLPWIPKDGSTECLTNCKCEWKLTVLAAPKGKPKTVRAEWKLNPAEHCLDCVNRDGKVFVFEVGPNVQVPPYIGGV